MAARKADRRSHIIAKGTSEAEPFTSPVHGGGAARLPSVNRARHGSALREQLERVRAELDARGAAPRPVGVEAPNGFYLEFESPPGFTLKLESLESSRTGIELIAVRAEHDQTTATVFVPHGQIEHFVKRVEEYVGEVSKKGRPKHQALIASIANIRLAVATSFWTDDLDLLPAATTLAWWEVWLRGNDDETLTRFRNQAKAMKIVVGDRRQTFPERTVVLAQGRLAEFAASLPFLDTLAELRRVDKVGSFFSRLPQKEQAEWASDLLHRTALPPKDAIAICILDTGVNHAHPLLAPVLARSDCHSCKPQWGVDDRDGHGTEMAGIAVYGDLRTALASASAVQLRHRLESVKILPPPPEENPRDLYGAITADAVGRAEISAPKRRRVFSLAVTSAESRAQGQPTSWSAEIDKLCADNDERRLFFVSAGNVNEDAGLRYPDQNETEAIHDPGQAWNALTVGAHTERIEIDEPSYAGWKSIAPLGDLAPTSTTSCIWDRQWSLKPDIVMEGGNMAISPNGLEADFPDSLSVLSTHHQPGVRHFSPTGDTSAATAGAARIGAMVRAAYPNLWPETIRALIVDSADWTSRMKGEFASANSVDEIEHLVRCFGYGVPNLERAVWSAANALTLVVEDELQPFDRDKSNEMNLHSLPWPRDELASLGATPVELRVTLSYFVEPNPARRGWRKRHRYGSHGLRFALQKPTESPNAFRRRVNGAARDDDEADNSTGDADGWLLKPKLRTKGSLHHDRWAGTAADLASRDHLAVFPVIGWWRERHQLGRSTSKARYALVISIRTPASSVDIYEAVRVKVKTPTAIVIPT